ncbi:hypothetical protein GGI12_004134 [Dipsacomyces acuminosporus]|nr:hypothetical protein GGI12_004134 [Dipsacomyces acuminosporus]
MSNASQRSGSADGHDTAAEFSSLAANSTLNGSTPGHSANRAGMDAPSAAPAGGKESAEVDSFISTMISQRDALRMRFKRWAGDVESAAKKLKYTTDNALVNQSTKLEGILDAGKQKVDGMASDRKSIRGQLSSFVSLLCDAQGQVFGGLQSNACEPSTAKDKGVDAEKKARASV